MPTPFVMSTEIEGKLRALSQLSAGRPISLERLLELSKDYDPTRAGETPSPVAPDQTVELPLGWRVTVSHECQPQGLCRHLSVSSPAHGRVPSPEVVVWIMRAVGFDPCELEECDLIWHEDYGGGTLAINVLQVVNRTAPGPRASKAN